MRILRPRQLELKLVFGERPLKVASSGEDQRAHAMDVGLDEVSLTPFARAVVMNSDNFFLDATMLLDYGFSRQVEPGPSAKPK